MKNSSQSQKELKLVLASKSPRRVDLLKMTRLPFEQIVLEIEETSNEKSIVKYAMDIANKKGMAVIPKLADKVSVVIAADTIVVLDDDIFGKPHDYDEAFTYMKELSGHVHNVITGVCLLLADKNKKILKKENFYSKTNVHFNNLDDEDIRDYLDNAKFSDKAGGYGVQESGITLINKVEGSISNVYGLPIDMVLVKMKTVLKTYMGKEVRLKKVFTA